VRAHRKNQHRTAPRTRPASRPEMGGRRGGKRTKAWIAGAAAISFVLGGVVAVGIVQFTSRDTTDVVEQAALEPLPGWDARGTARVEDSAGKLQLVVDLPDTKVSGFREVWLLDLAGKTPGLLSVGTLNGDQGVFDLPSGVDLAKYNIVDVSNEPFDGDPAHSSDSIVRGELGTVG
ncbi:MAG: anti-sigma factor, partial [Micrococcaceae bacterium]|nr:anti-sigma factor [Micrococcaceae bacterium]